MAQKFIVLCATFSFFWMNLSEQKMVNSIDFLLSLQDQQGKDFKSFDSGIEKASKQCKENFRWDRWNCSDSEFFWSLRKPITREMAYVSSIIAAGIMHEELLNCAIGAASSECRCVRTVEVRNGSAESNCVLDVMEGKRVTNEFIEGRELGAKDVIGVVNRHNYELGIEMVLKNRKELCTCKDISCVIKRCWYHVAPFSDVGKSLKFHYNRAIKVSAHNHILDPASLPKRRMVFLEYSPDYCIANVTKNWPGTGGRLCSRSKTGSRAEKRSCRELCRSCGHRVKKRSFQTTFRCNCTMQNCCQVTCDVCTKDAHKYYCDDKPDTSSLW